MKFAKISSSEFYESNASTILNGGKNARSFGLISIHEKKFKISWDSTEINPSIHHIENENYSIGIDLRFIIFNVITEHVVYELHLDYFFYEVKIYKQFIFIATELEIIKINFHTLRIIDKYTLPNYYENMTFMNEKIVVAYYNCKKPIVYDT